MKVKIKRFDKSIPLPEYKTAGSVCVDLYSREEVTIPAGEIGYIPLNVAIEAPEGYWVLVAARSSTHKLGLIPANGVAIGDGDFKGDNDEYKMIVYNFKKEDVTVEKGIRVAQMMAVKHEKMDLEDIDTLGNPDRGGIGSTGNR